MFISSLASVVAELLLLLFSLNKSYNKSPGGRNWPLIHLNISKHIIHLPKVLQFLLHQTTSFYTKQLLFLYIKQPSSVVLSFKHIKFVSLRTLRSSLFFWILPSRGHYFTWVSYCLGATTFSKRPLSITTLSIIGLSATQHK